MRVHNRRAAYIILLLLLSLSLYDPAQLHETRNNAKFDDYDFPTKYIYIYIYEQNILRFKREFPFDRVYAHSTIERRHNNNNNNNNTYIRVTHVYVFAAQK